MFLSLSAPIFDINNNDLCLFESQWIVDHRSGERNQQNSEILISAWKRHLFSMKNSILKDLTGSPAAYNKRSFWSLFGKHCIMIARRYTQDFTMIWTPISCKIFIVCSTILFRKHFLIQCFSFLLSSGLFFNYSCAKKSEQIKKCFSSNNLPSKKIFGTRKYFQKFSFGNCLLEKPAIICLKSVIWSDRGKRYFWI